MTISPYKGLWPKIARNCFIADTATVLGDVILQEGTSVWFGAVLRADGGKIRIGKKTNIQDNCVLHAHPGNPIIIGDHVSLAHGSLIHSARVGSNSSIGMGTALLSGSQVGRNCEIGSGLVLFKDVKIPDNTLLVGSFNTESKTVDAARRKMLRGLALDHYKLGNEMNTGTRRHHIKSFTNRSRDRK